MKKIIAIFLIILFPATVTVYAQIYRSEEKHNNEATGIYNEPPMNSIEEYTEESPEDYSGGLFRSDTQEPGLRPDVNEGIGEEGEDDAPINDGLGVIIVCSLFFVIIEFFIHKYSNNKKQAIKLDVDKVQQSCPIQI